MFLSLFLLCLSHSFLFRWHSFVLVAAVGCGWWAVLGVVLGVLCVVLCCVVLLLCDLLRVFVVSVFNFRFFSSSSLSSVGHKHRKPPLPHVLFLFHLEQVWWRWRTLFSFPLRTSWSLKTRPTSIIHIHLLHLPLLLLLLLLRSLRPP